MVIISHSLSEFCANPIADIPSSPTSTDLVRKRQGMLARAFRDRMTRGQSFKVSNDYRNFFYQEVIKLANEVKINFCALIGFQVDQYFKAHDSRYTC